MKCVFALISPPLAMLLCGKPFQAIGAAGLLIVASQTLSIGVGGVLLAFVVLWAFRVVGHARATVQINRFLTVHYKPKPARR